MSVETTAFARKSDEVEEGLTNPALTDDRETRVSLGVSFEQVEMRNSSVRPASHGNREADDGRETSTQGQDDAADGFDALGPESFAPLLSTNQYTVRKLAAQALMDVALMMANISQLRTLIAAGPDGMEYYYVLLSMVGFSLGSQVIFAVLIFVIWMRESEQQQREEHLAMMKKARQTIAATTGATSTITAESNRISSITIDENYQKHLVTTRLNYVTMVLVFLITVSNMFITGFGIELDSPSP